MKVLVPSRHNEIMIQDLKRGDAFWNGDRLYVKVEIHGGSYNHDQCHILDLDQGVVFVLNNDVLVTLDNNVCVTELQSEERMNREINIECRARELSEKLEEIGSDSQFNSIFIQHQNRGGNYTGPTYNKELERLQEALES